MIDEEEYELQDLGLGLTYDDLLIASLLLLDDIVVLADTPEDLQAMLTATYKFACRHRLLFGAEKCKAMVIGPLSACFENVTWQLGHLQIPTCNKYRWLGTMITPQVYSIHDHIVYKKQINEIILQTCLAAASDQILNRIKVKSLVKLHTQCLVPSLSYGCEPWTPTAIEIEELEQIQLNVLRRILKIPKSTPRMAILAETGCLPIITIIHRRKLIYLHSLLIRSTQLCGKILRSQSTTYSHNPLTFHNQCKILLREYNLPIDMHNIQTKTKNQWQRMVKRATKTQADQLYSQSRLKKLAYTKAYKTTIKLEKYLTELPRKEATAIFKLRTGMIKVKANFRGQNTDIKCDKCTLDLNDDINHLLICPGYDQLRRTFNVYNFNPAFWNEPPRDTLMQIASFLIIAELV